MPPPSAIDPAIGCALQARGGAGECHQRRVFKLVASDDMLYSISHNIHHRYEALWEQDKRGVTKATKDKKRVNDR